MPPRCRWPTAARGPSTRCALGSSRSRRSTRSAGPRVARAGVLEDGTRVVEAAEAIPLDPSRLDVMRGVEPRAGAVDRAVPGSSPGGDRRRHGDDGRRSRAARGPRSSARADARALRRRDDVVRRAASLRPAEGRHVRAGRRAGGALPPDRPAGSLRRAARFRGGRRARRCARVAGGGAGAGRGRGSRPARLRSGALRPRRHRGGSGGCDHVGGEGARRGRPSLRRRGRPLRRVRRVGASGESPGACPWSWSRSAATRVAPARISSSSGRSWGAL